MALWRVCRPVVLRADSRSERVLLCPGSPGPLRGDFRSLDAVCYCPDAPGVSVSAGALAPGLSGAVWGDHLQSVSGRYGQGQYPVSDRVVCGTRADAHRCLVSLLPIPGILTARAASG